MAFNSAASVSHIHAGVATGRTSQLQVAGAHRNILQASPPHHPHRINGTCLSGARLTPQQCWRRGRVAPLQRGHGGLSLFNLRHTREAVGLGFIHCPPRQLVSGLQRALQLLDLKPDPGPTETSSRRHLASPAAGCKSPPRHLRSGKAELDLTAGSRTPAAAVSSTLRVAAQNSCSRPGFPD